MQRGNKNQNNVKDVKWPTFITLRPAISRKVEARNLKFGMQIGNEVY